MTRIIPAALALFVAVTTHAQQPEESEQPVCGVIKTEYGDSEEGCLINGARVGDWTIKFPSGGVWSGPYVDGVRHGLWSFVGSERSYTTYYVQGSDIDNAFHNKVDDVDSLLRFVDVVGVGVNERIFQFGGTYLEAAIESGHPVEVVRTLLELGADPNVDSGEPMWATLPYDHCEYPPNGLEILDELVMAGGDVTITSYSRTLLHGVAEVNCDDIAVIRPFVARLTALGLDIDVLDEDAATPLSWAAQERVSPSVVRALIEYGADVNSRDRFGRTPLHNVTYDSSPDPVLGEVITGNEPTEEESTRVQSSIGLLLLRNGADPDLTDENGMTPLDSIDEDSPLRRTRFYRRLVRQVENQ